ncbi:biopolymer transporter ExbB [Salinivibrio kushneri]|jgi:biopolymer transport protein ExbB|uniref:Biopolymer transporter ExbB n=1 Tax=Salinivibrio kushneri TaxID=1908198 RepID=A0AB36JYF5_9GAMM|nr:MULTISPECIES: MotA/TolQ/ExbB proton channel family protein [Salinivibrio]ODP98003.1 biopolymer transporter ExbB [Salinivibrio sp. BNH]OOE40024.1 biopolymer transporter ExbB [Salinivibrio kushneri]OOE68665.1 biopolymer transporter ExbB [Salinivibrio kushneri]OOE98817.1 biopolymer transporter ExbB [Salinivibrio sp. IB643]OOF19593.1 biopolymer transporter ExbB [Salinivibrio sp. MA427]
MQWILSELESIRHFLGMGGDVLVAIFILSVFLWCALLERWFYFIFVAPRAAKSVVTQWQQRKDHKSWASKRIREELVSQRDIENKRGLPIVKVLIAMCPLLGLLGTVVGMIHVFDTLAVVGTGSPRAMASGISKATIPTLAGMVASLSGLFFSTRLDHLAKLSTRKLEDKLKHVTS